MSKLVDLELARQIEFMNEEAVVNTTIAMAGDVILHCIGRGDLIALDMACKWLDVFGERGAHPCFDGIASRLEDAMFRKICLNRAAKPTSLRDLPLRFHSKVSAGVDRVAIVGATDSAKLNLLASSLLRRGVATSALSCFHIASNYPKKLYGTAASAWYPSRSTNRLGSHQSLPTPSILSNLSELKHKENTLVIILGLSRIPARTIREFPVGIVNAHNGLLPDFRGLDSPAWAYANGAPLGYTLHFINAELDSGEVIVRKTVGSGSKAEFDNGIVEDLSELVFSILSGRSPIGFRFALGPYYYRMSLRTRQVLDRVLDIERARN